MRYVVKSTPIKGGKNTLGVDKIGRGHWRAQSTIDAGRKVLLDERLKRDSTIAPSGPKRDPEKASDRKFKRGLEKMRVSYGPGSPGHPANVNTPEPPKPTMDTYRAVMLAEGAEEGTREEQLEAWQHLVDTDLVWKLQGSFGRTAQRLIEDGLIHEKGK